MDDTGSADDVAVLPPYPKAVGREAYEAVRQDMRTEAVARTAFLAMRGRHPGQAWEAALRGMARDEAERERQPYWDGVAEIAKSWPPPARDLDGTPRHGVFELAEALRGALDARHERPELVDPAEGLRGITTDARVLAVATAFFHHAYGTEHAATLEALRATGDDAALALAADADRDGYGHDGRDAHEEDDGHDPYAGGNHGHDHDHEDEEDGWPSSF